VCVCVASVTYHLQHKTYSISLMHDGTKSGPLTFVGQKRFPAISYSSVATSLRCCRIFVRNLLSSLMVKELWKLVIIWRNIVVPFWLTLTNG